ncbi:MAG: nitroreductase family protein, partial [Rickettsia endosymbiont of Ixodes persulcatus]|nr:nitroreductase family protein [Rickettsia endosymbiont of Ixodes persulcatus]
PPTKNEFKDIVDKTGVNINKLFNTHGVKYRELNLKEKLKDMSDDEKYNNYHGMREPWRLVHISKDKLGDFSRDITRFAFPDSPDKREDHFHAVTNLGGMLLLILKDDPRQRQSRENYFAFGAFAQNLMLLLYEAGIGTCWKSPQYIFDPKIRKALGVRDNEILAGFLYLTDLEEVPTKAKRKNKNLITEFE